MNLDVQVRGAKELARKLEALGKDLATPRPFYKLACVETLRWINQNFDADGKMISNGQGWAPFKPQLVYGRLARGRWVGKGKARRFDTSAKLLRDTGRLRASIRWFTSDHLGKVYTQLSYAVAHHHGAPSRGLPSRAIIPSPYHVGKLIMQKADAWVAQRIAARGLKRVA